MLPRTTWRKSVINLANAIQHCMGDTPLAEWDFLFLFSSCTQTHTPKNLLQRVLQPSGENFEGVSPVGLWGRREMGGDPIAPVEVCHASQKAILDAAPYKYVQREKSCCVTHSPDVGTGKHFNYSPPPYPILTSKGTVCSLCSLS